MKFQGFNLSITQIANIFPLIVLAPRFFSGAVKLGDLQQAALAFLNVHDSLSFFRNSYDDFAGYRATLNRLTGLLDVNDQARELPAATISDSADGLEIRNLTVTRPDGGALIEDLTLDLRSGDSLIVKGPSGSGKTSLLRSLAGLWPYASGTIHRPADKRALFLSQQTYVPFGSFADRLGLSRAARVHFGRPGTRRPSTSPSWESRHFHRRGQELVTNSLPRRAATPRVCPHSYQQARRRLLGRIHVSPR